MDPYYNALTRINDEQPEAKYRKRFPKDTYVQGRIGSYCSLAADSASRRNLI